MLLKAQTTEVCQWEAKEIFGTFPSKELRAYALVAMFSVYHRTSSTNHGVLRCMCIVQTCLYQTVDTFVRSSSVFIGQTFVPNCEYTCDI